MSYENKKAVIISLITEAKKFLSPNQNIRLYTKQPPLVEFNENEIRDILLQFENLKKLTLETISIGEQQPYIKKFFSPFEIPNNFVELSNVDFEYFEKELQQDKKYLKSEKLELTNNFFIEFNSDRRILLNGKIDLAKPDFGGENEAIFIFLYNNPNKIFTKKDIENGTNIKVTKSFDKIVENLGFRRGLKTTFFDINKSTIKFKNPVAL